MKVLISALIAVVFVATVLWVIFAAAYDKEGPLNEKSGISVIFMEAHIRSHPLEPEKPQQEKGDFIFRTPPRRPLHTAKLPVGLSSIDGGAPPAVPGRLFSGPAPYVDPSSIPNIPKWRGKRPQK
ncbi:MAG: hypothetical protein OXP71_01115 [Candidatus Poribacteria bacterium]|nr:hypothetical protein [Candidatus Poribacteria bacterium]